MLLTLRQRAVAPRDAASLAMLRVLLGLVLAGAVVRYFASGWIERFYVAPTFHFHHYGFSWVTPLPGPALYVLFAALGVASLCVAAGLFYRASAAFVFVGFTYLHLLDVTNYLNHYYLVGLLSFWLMVLPLHRFGSLDARRRPELRADTLPAWMLWVVRFQVGVVYVFAAIAKLGPDWLVHGQPLGIWMAARTETPLIGPLLGEPWVALAMSWAGLLYDLTIVFWLSWRRSRPYAFAVVCVFHTLTSVFFDIGIFPVLMTVAATVLFDGSWPRRFAGSAYEMAPTEARSRPPLPAWATALLAVYVAMQVAIPLRGYLYGGDVLWHEQGMRWSWRVKVREKNGDVSYRVRMHGRSTERTVRPSRYLSPRQEAEFATQPDQILQLAHAIRDELTAQGHRGVEVRCDAFVSLNGRRSQRLIDPDVDLARVEDGWAPAPWILPAPDGPPPTLRRTRRSAR